MTALITKNQDPQEKLLRKINVGLGQFDKNRETILEANPNGQTTNTLYFAITLKELLSQAGVSVIHTDGPLLEDVILRVSPAPEGEIGDSLACDVLAPETDLQFRGRIEHECTIVSE